MRYLKRLWLAIRRFNAWMDGMPGNIEFNLMLGNQAHGVLRVAAFDWIGRTITIPFRFEFPYGLHQDYLRPLLRREIISQARKAGYDPLSFVLYIKTRPYEEYIITREERAGITN